MVDPGIDSEFQAAHKAHNSQSKSLVFIDSEIEDYEVLVNGISDQTEVVVLDGAGDRLVELTTTLKQYQKQYQQQNRIIDAIHLFSHGSPGCLYLGDRQIETSNLEDYAQQFKQWNIKEIFLYGCQVAAGKGAKFIEKLSELTQATIAAADRLVGNSNRGGTWDLGFTTGDMQTPTPLLRSIQENYQGVLATIAVTSLADSGTGSLRSAIATASAGDTIQFDSSLANSTITLTTGQLEIDKDVIIDGGQAPGLTINGNRAFRVFDVTQGTGAIPVNFTLKNLIIANGKTSEPGEDGAGAGIRTANKSTLTVENSEFKNNIAVGEGGGAIFSGWRSKTTVINSKFDGNDGTPDLKERGGGAIAIKSESELLVRGSSFSNNKGINGGAINSLLSKLTVENSTFINNESITHTTKTQFFGLGGAILTDGASGRTNDNIGGEIIIRNSHFEGNKAFEGGGANLYAYPPDTVMVEESSFINNSAIFDGEARGNGGGIWHGNSEMSILNSTFANNTAEKQGGGFWVDKKSEMTIENSTFSGNRAGDLATKKGLGGAMVLNCKTTLVNNIIAHNVAGHVAAGIFTSQSQPTSINVKNTKFVDNVVGNGANWNLHTNRELIDQGGNVQWPASKNVNATANITIVETKLGPLQDNGNGRLTHVLMPGS